MPQFSSHSHDSDLQRMGRALKAIGSTLEKQRSSLKKTQFRQTQEWCDPIEELQGRITRHATRIKSYQVKQPSQQTFQGMDPSVLETSPSLLKEPASRVKENQVGANTF